MRDDQFVIVGLIHDHSDGGIEPLQWIIGAFFAKDQFIRSCEKVCHDVSKCRRFQKVVLEPIILLQPLSRFDQQIEGISQDIPRLHSFRLSA